MAHIPVGESLILNINSKTWKRRKLFIYFLFIRQKFNHLQLQFEAKNRYVIRFAVNPK